ncbi:MAG TPA: cytochrome P450 [Roseococcus sp.]|nr:cytochrome P450 [Roseococcus sp.]
MSANATTPSPSTPVSRGAPPGPKGAPLLGSLKELAADPLAFYARLARDHGDVSAYRVAGLQFVFVNGPAEIHHILAGNERNYRRSAFGNKLLKLAMGDNIITTDGAEWLRRRKLLQPLFTKKQMARFAGMIVEEAARQLDRLAEAGRDGRPVDVDAAMKRVTLSVVGRALFNQDLGADGNEIAAHLKTGGDYFIHRFKNPLAPPLWVPTARNRAFRKSMDSIAYLVPKLIAARRAQGDAGPDDLLGRLLEARFEDSGAGYTDLELKNEIQVMIGAGYETTALTLTWAAWLLARHPAVADRLAAEAAEVLGGRDPVHEDMERLIYTRQVVEETMRLYPASWGMARTTIGADVLGGYAIPAGRDVVFSPFVLHRRPDIWPEPERFDPARFAPGADRDRPSAAYIPFGFGRRSCLGLHFAMLEAVLLLAMMAQRFRFALPDGAPPVVPEPLMTMGPKGGLHLHLLPATGPR